MAIRRRRRRRGTEVFGFFAANDGDLSAYLNALDTTEQQILVATLDAALAIPSQELFEQRLAALWFQYQTAPAGSQAEARTEALGRMLGYEYERIYKASAEALQVRFTQAYAELEGQDSLPSDQSDPFLVAAEVLTRTCFEAGHIGPPEKQLASCCLVAAATAASRIAAEGDPDGDDIADLVAAVQERGTSEDAGRVVYAISWFYALLYLGESIDDTVRQRWLSAMAEALGPIDNVQVADWERLNELFESRRTWPDNVGKFPNTLIRWLMVHLGHNWEELPDPYAVLGVFTACTEAGGLFSECLGTSTA